MAIDFPDSPSNGDIHTVSGKRWQWDGEKWQAYGASLAAGVLFVDQANSRVGINDTTPSYGLDVNGTARVTGAITASGGVVGALTGTAATATALATARTIGGVSFDGTANINLPGVNATGNQNTSGTALTVTQAAQTAITSVGTLTGLTLSGDLAVNGGDIAAAIGLNDTKGLTLTYSSEVKAGLLLNPNSGEVRMGALNSTGDYFTTFYADNAERMRITAAGNVGIGTTSPSAHLHIVGGAFATNITVGGRDLQSAQIIGATSMRGGVLVTNLNDYRNTNNNASFMHLDPYATGLTTASFAFRAAAGATLVDTFWVKGTGEGYFYKELIVDAVDANPVYISTGNAGGSIAIGNGALAAATVGNNLAVGINALNDATTSGWNTAFGNWALDGITANSGHPNYAQYNVAVGHEALSAAGTWGGNVAMGFRAGKATTSNNNVAIGMQSMDGAVSGGNNVAVGYNTGRACNSSGNVNVWVGASAGTASTSGSHNVYVGYLAGYASTSGASNVIVGSDCGRTLTDAVDSVIIGYQAGYYVTGGLNTFVGKRAGHQKTTGGTNTAVGWSADYSNTSGGNNLTLGYNAQPSSNTVSNEVTLGNNQISNLRCQDTTISQVSDERDKTNIQDLDMGLEFICRLQPRRFEWNMRDGGLVGVEETGFVAQELQQAMVDEGKVIPGLVHDNNPDKLEAAPMALFTTLIKAVQELSDKVDALT